MAKRIGLGRTQKLIEELRRELSMQQSTLQGIKRETVSATNSAATTLTANQSGALVVMSGGAAATATLPSVADGLYFEFFAASAESHIINGGSSKMQGALLSNGNAATLLRTAVTNRSQIALNGTNPAIGDRILCFSDGTNWYVHGWTNDTCNLS